MIYIDTSVALAQILSEDIRPPVRLWSEALVSSRLLEYEVFTRINARGLTRTHSAIATSLLNRIAMLELLGEVMERIKSPFPVPVRTLDATHLAAIGFIAEREGVALATYDLRMARAAAAIGIPLYNLD